MSDVPTAYAGGGRQRSQRMTPPPAAGGLSRHHETYPLPPHFDATAKIGRFQQCGIATSTSHTYPKSHLSTADHRRYAEKPAACRTPKAKIQDYYYNHE